MSEHEELLTALLALYDAYDNASWVDYGDHTGMTWADEWPMCDAYEKAAPLVEAYQRKNV